MFGIVLLALGLRLFVVEAYKIPSGSMWPSLEVQDHIFVSKFARVPDYGDVIVFDYPADRRMAYVKRVLALAGDRLQFIGPQPVINGWAVPRCPLGRLQYTDPNSLEPSHAGQAFVEFLGRYTYIVFEESERLVAENSRFDVPKGEVFVVGDNRNNSFDSRNWNAGRAGGVSFEDVKGRSSVIWLAIKQDGNLNFDRMLHHLADPPSVPETASAESRRRLADCVARRPAVTRPPKAAR